MTTFEIAGCMAVNGGNFARNLAAAWFAADPDNRATIETAFADLFSTYNIIATEQKRNEV